VCLRNYQEKIKDRRGGNLTIVPRMKPMSGFGTVFNASSTNAGWTIGAGGEVALAQNWTARVEYLYIGTNVSLSGTLTSIGKFPKPPAFTTACFAPASTLNFPERRRNYETFSLSGAMCAPPFHCYSKKPSNHL
jgi:hypothetical protein